MGDANSDDNATSVIIGVPDLVVTDFTVAPMPPIPDVPTTFTVTVKNQGTGLALNPDCNGGFYVDFFTRPVPSYPGAEPSDLCATQHEPIRIGKQATLTAVYTFTSDQINNIHKFFAKADNFDEAHLYGLVPEYNEMNNIGEPIRQLHLPLIMRTSNCQPQ